jgi:3',5'-cyclic AMP phosphodiesterase CpdA
MKGDFEMYRIAHISDLHISEIDEDNLTNLRWLASLLGKRLKIDVVAEKHNEDKLNALKTELKKLRPKLIVVTGDITNFGDEKSFEKAAEILTELKEVANAEQVICIPGNHDSLSERVADLRSSGLWGRLAIWALAKINREIYISAKQAANMDDGTALSLLGNYRKFSKGRYVEVNPSKPVFIQTEWGEIAMFLFNSTNDKGVMANEGRIGAKQYNALNDAIATHGPRINKAVRMALLHHHPITVPVVKADAVERGYNWMVDGTQFIEYIGRELGEDYGFHFILHGHQHEPYIFQYGQPLNAHIVAAGSALAGENPNRGSFDVIDVRTPFEAVVRQFDYSPTGYKEKDKPYHLSVRPLSTVRITPKGYPLTGEDLALQGTVKGREETYDEDRAYDLLEFNAVVTPEHNYVGEYRRTGRIVRETIDKGIVYSISGNPPRSFTEIGVTARGQSSRNPTPTDLDVEEIDDKKTEIVFRVLHTVELRKGDTFDVTMKFHWQSNDAFPIHYDGVNLMYFEHPVGILSYQVKLPWNPPNPKVIAFGVEEDFDVHLTDKGVIPQPDGTFLYYFKISNPKPLAYLISFIP